MTTARETTNRSSRIEIRRITAADFKEVRKILGDLHLCYESQTLDPFWVASKHHAIVGVVQLEEFPDFFFLSSLGVVESERRQGVANQMLNTLFQNAAKDIYLYTQIPEFFIHSGFERAPSPPKGIPPRSKFQCEGCIADVTCFCLVKRAS